MGDESGAQQSIASPWPIVVAFGLALSEVGIFIGLRFAAVAGLLVFVGAVAGILTESGYISRPEWATGLMAAALVVIGVILMIQHGTGTPVRGQSIAMAGVLSFAGALAWTIFVWKRTRQETSPSKASGTTSD